MHKECFILCSKLFVNQVYASSNAKCMMYATDNKEGLYHTILIVGVEF
jgi:hypothetical protein